MQVCPIPGCLPPANCHLRRAKRVLVRICELFQEPVRLNCAALILVHNHPSKDPTPSTEDIHVTRAIVKAGQLLNIQVLDHLILAGNRYVSLKERGVEFG